MKSLKRAALWVALLAMPVVQAVAAEPDAPEKIVSRLDAVTFEIQKRLAAPINNMGELEKKQLGSLVEFYATHGPAWVDAQGFTKRALAARAEILRADDWGLVARDYDLPKESELKDEAAPMPAMLADAELKMSRAVLAYSRDARGGRIDPSKLSAALDPTITLVEPQELMDAIVKLDDPAPYLRALHPQHAQFEALRKKLMEARGGSEPKPQVHVPDGPSLKQGLKHPQVAILRQRLGLETGGDATLYSPDVAAAVKEYQKSKGLQPTGVLTAATRNSLNSKPTNRSKLIIANMERWRWLPRDMGSYHIRLNIPEYTVRVVDNGKVIHAERTVVGKVNQQTPVFSDQMEFIDFNPFWNVPNSIKQEEIRPYLQQTTGGFFGFMGGNPRVLAQHNLYVKYNGRQIDPSSVDWNSVDIRNFHFYQPPGPSNVLGVVKFMFPNRHDVYLHDTPQKNLFNETVRTYSHGCVRVRNPLKLAEIILSRDQGWSMASIEKAVASRDNQTVNLKTFIPMHLTYFTAVVEDDGDFKTFGDVYGHDAKVMAALKL